MSERSAREFLTAFRRTLRDVRLYPAGHPLVEDAFRAAVRSADDLIGSRGEVVLTVFEDALYLDTTLLAHASLEFNSVMREFQDRGIDSITLIGPVAAPDLVELAAFVSGVSDDLPAAGTVRLNERPLSHSDLEGSEAAPLRRSYASSLDVLRTIGVSMRDGASDFELGGVIWAVENLVEQTLAQPGASLLLSTVKSHDEYTFYHSVNTCILALSIGRLLELDEGQLVQLGVGALLHDIGKVGVSAAILQHPGRLAPEQWSEIKIHPQEGAQAILAAAGAEHEVAAAIALQHHARFDGSGYPNLIHSLEPSALLRHPEHSHGSLHAPRRGPLHFFSRLVAVADTYDAITTRRAYRRAETPNRALHVMLAGAGSSYDPDFVRAFIHMMGVYPSGSLLQVATGEIFMVTHQIDGDPERPAGVLVRDAGGNQVEEAAVEAIDKPSIVEQLLPDRVGIDPAAYLEKLDLSQALTG